MFPSRKRQRHQRSGITYQGVHSTSKSSALAYYLQMALTQKLEQPNAAKNIQPILTKVLQHQKWMKALLTDSITTLAYKAIFIRRDLAISTIRGQVLKDTLRSLRTSLLLGDLMFFISSEDLENLKRLRNECYMFQVLEQAAQLKQGQPQEFKVP